MDANATFELSRHRIEPRDVRLDARSGCLRGQTSGLAPGRVQANLVILPADLAADFLRFCHRNPKPCPVIAMSDPGNPMLPDLGEDVDVRTDLPLYREWREGELVAETADIRDLWRDDLVAFLIGCSFSFEEALLADDVPLRHIAESVNVPMYRTKVPTRRSGPFYGPLVVSMRPLRPADAIRAIQITSRLPSVHGAPIHLGNPEALGIADLSRPDYGDPVRVEDDELPVFWACGVTPQSVIRTAKPKSPSCMRRGVCWLPI